MVFRCVPAKYVSHLPVKEGVFTDEALKIMNDQCYQIYHLPNYPKTLPNKTISGEHIDVFEWCYVDMDLKDGKHANKDEFISLFADFLLPSKIVDSGNGVHVYFRISDLDSMSFLRLQRRLCRKFNTDEAVAKIYQLMRVPGYMNVKEKGNPKPCEVKFDTDAVYTCEHLDAALPPILKEDEGYCQDHYNRTYSLGDKVVVDEKLPAKFSILMSESDKVRRIWLGDTGDRSEADYALGHILLAHQFSREEALSVLVNLPKARERSYAHRVSYATNIADKIWPEEKKVSSRSVSVGGLLRRGEAIQGIRFSCWDVFDGTRHGFHLTQVLGLVGGSGSGKTTLSLNYFLHFAQKNPEYIHVFVSLEQPCEEIALRWDTMVSGDTSLHDKVFILGNYNEDGTHRGMTLEDVEAEVLLLEKDKGRKVGCLVIDHIGALKKQSVIKGDKATSEGLIDIAQKMKAVAKRTNTFMIMQSQTSREKAGAGDLELDKDAAYGTTVFEWFVDYLVTTWQPLMKVYKTNPEMACSAFKYCKIRKKNVHLDALKEGDIYILMYDSANERLRIWNQQEKAKYPILAKKAAELRSRDKKSDVAEVQDIDWVEERRKIDAADNVVSIKQKDKR